MESEQTAAQVAPGCEREVVDGPASRTQRRHYGELSQDVVDRFWNKVDRSGGDAACWPWTGGKMPSGYGNFGLGVKPDCITAKSHRLALYLTTGVMGDIALHSCDVPSCCNPAHLRWGDARQNMRDIYERNRANPRGPTGEANSHAKLTAADVLRIREEIAAGASKPRLAEQYGVTNCTIHYINLRKTWRHL